MAIQWMANGVQVDEHGAEEIMFDGVQLSEEEPETPPLVPENYPFMILNIQDRRPRSVVAY